MRQVILRIPIPFTPGVAIYGFGLMLVVGWLAGTWVASRRARREGLAVDVPDLGFWLLLGGILGARLFYVAQYREHFGGLLDFFRIWEGGLVWYGGVIGAVAAFFWQVRRKKLPTWKLCDVLAPGLALGMAFGRVGCFLNGCCYGDPTDLPWAVRFPADSIPAVAQYHAGLLPHEHVQSLPVHPTQLYSALDGLLLFLLLTAYYPLRRRDGEATALLATVYPITRFLIEILRDDERSIAGTGLTISQNISILVLIVGVSLWAWLLRRPATYTATAPNRSSPTAPGTTAAHRVTPQPAEAKPPAAG